MVNGNRIKPGVFIKMMVFKQQNSLFKFGRDGVAGRETLLTIQSNPGTQQPVFFAVNHRCIRIIEERSGQHQETRQKPKQDEHTQTCYPT